MPRLRRAWPGAALGLAALAIALPAQAAPAPATDPYHAIAALDARIASTGWRLARANAAYCADVVPAIGLVVQDLQSWADPAAARAAFAIDPDTQVVVGAVATGSPAAQSGLIAGQALHSIADSVLGADLPAVAANSHERQIALTDLVDTSLRDNGSVALGIDGPGGERRLVRIAAEPVCASRYEIVTQGKQARADGRRILVGTDIASELADDDQFAFVVAHELAHNVLGHVAMLAREGRGWKRVRRTEREADRLAVWLMANAGYEPQSATRFMRGWARARDVGFLDPTHDAWDERVAAIEGEIALIAASGARPGGYDWSARFPPAVGAARSAP